MRNEKVLCWILQTKALEGNLKSYISNIAMLQWLQAQSWLHTPIWRWWCGECVSFHWITLSNFHWLVATDSRNKNQSLYPGKSQACMKRLSHGIQKRFSFSAFGGDFNWGGMHMNSSSSLENFILSYTLIYIPLHNSTDTIVRLLEYRSYAHYTEYS